MSESWLVEKVIQWVREHKQRGVADDFAITTDTDLLESGLLDSLGFVDLIVFINSQDGCQMDLSDADPKEFAMVGGICRIALRDQH